MGLNLVDKTFLIMGLVDFGGAFICIGVALRMAYKNMDTMLMHLRNSPSIMALAPLRQGGAWGKLLLVGGISGLLTFPNFYIKRGHLSAGDLKCFPAVLRHKLVVLQWCVIALLLVMVGLAAVVKLGVV